MSGVVRGYRDPMTFKRAGTIEGLTLIGHVLNIDQLSNEQKHQYVFELMQGDDPRQSDWFKMHSAIEQARPTKLKRGVKAKTHEAYVADLLALGVGVTPIGRYVGNRIKIDHRCACGNVWSVLPKHVIAGRRCGCRKYFK